MQLPIPALSGLRTPELCCGFLGFVALVGLVCTFVCLNIYKFSLPLPSSSGQDFLLHVPPTPALTSPRPRPPVTVKSADHAGYRILAQGLRGRRSQGPQTRFWAGTLGLP